MYVYVNAHTCNYDAMKSCSIYVGPIAQYINTYIVRVAHQGFDTVCTTLFALPGKVCQEQDALEWK